jgi:hypothetical protein
MADDTTQAWPAREARAATWRTDPAPAGPIILRDQEVTMRVVSAAALTAAALLLSSMASAQGLGEAAAREREKRKTAPTTPAKVITQDDIRTVATPTDAQGNPVTETGTAGTPAAGAAAGAGATAEKKPPTLEEQMQKEEQARLAAQQTWRDEVARAQEKVAAHQQNVDRLNGLLNDYRYGFNTPSVARAQQELADEKTKLAAAQQQVETLQEQGRRQGFR